MKELRSERVKCWLVALVCLLLALPVKAQYDAAGILERTSEAFRKAGGVLAEFKVEAGGAEMASGTIRLLGEKFVLQTDEAKTWFDGHTQWTYLPSTNEVNISNPTPAELQSLNPFAWLSLYRHGYRAVYENSSDRSLHKIVLIAERGQELQRITLYLQKANLFPTRIVLQQRTGEPVEIAISSFRTGINYPDGFFVFNPQQYPGAEVIDLR